MPRFIQRNYSAALGGGVCRTSTVGLDVNTSGASAAFWYYPLAADGNVMASFENGANSATFRLNIENNTGKLFTWTVTSAVGRAHKPSYVISLNTWHYIVVTYANIGGTSRRSTIYVDGVSIGTETSAGLADTSSRFSCSTGATSRLESDIRVFNSELSASDVLNLYYNNLNPSTPTINWRLDEGEGSSATDFSGNGWTGTITSASWTSNTPMKARPPQRNANASIFINGTDGAAGNALSIANNASLSPTAAVTLEIRFRPTARKAAILFDNSTLGVTNSYYLSISADGGLYWYSTIGGVAKNILGTTTKVKFNEWNMVNATYDGAAIKLFLNGSQLAETLAATGSMGTNSGPLRIGAYYSGGTSQTFQGSISQPRVYAAGCTLAEHQDRYYRSITSAALQAALVLDLNTEIGAGSTVTDLSGLGNNATMGASASWTSDSPFKSRKASVNANMVRNGDFEYAPPFTAATTTGGRWVDGTATGSTTNDLFGWYSIVGIGSFGVSFDSTVSRSGGCSLKLDMDATGRGRVWSAPYEASTTPTLVRRYGIPVQPNVAYTLSGFIKTLNVVASSARISIAQYSGDGTLGTTTNSAFVSGTSDWTAVSASVVMAATTQYVGIRCDIATAGNTQTAWFDDLTFLPVYPEGRVPANGNLVKNFDFEVVPAFTAETTTAARWIDGTAGGSTTNSTYKWATVSGAITASASVSYDTTVFHSGSASLKLSTLNTSGAAVAANTLNTASPADASVMLRLLPSTAYTLSFYLKTNNVATNGAYAFIREYSGALSTLVTTNSTKLSGTNDWTLVTLNFTTNAATQFAALALLNNVPGNVSDAWFDDIYLAPTTNPGRVIIT